MWLQLVVKLDQLFPNADQLHLYMAHINLPSIDVPVHSIHSLAHAYRLYAHNSHGLGYDELYRGLHMNKGDILFR